MDEMVAAICAEIKFRGDTNSVQLETIYFGGGTPSVLSIVQLERILKTIKEYHKSNPSAEITLEVNPDDLDLDYLDRIRALGVNRLSIGIQSFHSSHLSWMNRSHTSKQATNAIKWAKEKGFDTSSVDLIYGFKDLTMAQWKDNVERVLNSGLNHLSCYALTIEDNTPFAKIQRKQNIRLVNDTNAWKQFEYVHSTAIQMGWQHYELSNFAKEGHTSAHNQSYWNSKPYMGIGPGAHSFDGINTRSWNVSDNWKYIDLVNSGNINYHSSEQLNTIERQNEKIMVGLRTAEGISLELINNAMNNKEHPVHSFLQQNLAQISDNKLKLTIEGWWQSDHIIGTLFQV